MKLLPVDCVQWSGRNCVRSYRIFGAICCSATWYVHFPLQMCCVVVAHSLRVDRKYITRMQTKSLREYERLGFQYFTVLCWYKS